MGFIWANYYTIPETNNKSTWKNGCLEDDPFFLGWSIFRGIVSFGKFLNSQETIPSFIASWENPKWQFTVREYPPPNPLNSGLGIIVICPENTILNSQENYWNRFRSSAWDFSLSFQVIIHTWSGVSGMTSIFSRGPLFLMAEKTSLVIISKSNSNQPRPTKMVGQKNIGWKS